MSKKHKIGLFVGIIIFLSILMFAVTNQVRSDVATAANVGEDGKIKVPSGTDASSRGTVDNPFVLLEIVPNESYAQMGYYIAGQEPVDIDKMVEDNYPMNLLTDTLKVLDKVEEVDEQGNKKITYKNKDLFLRYSIGLAYKDENRTPDVEKYYFAGWYYDPECTRRYDFNTAVEESFTLYAKWVTSEDQVDELSDVGGVSGLNDSNNQTDKNDMSDLNDASNLADKDNASGSDDASNLLDKNDVDGLEETSDADDASDLDDKTDVSDSNDASDLADKTDVSDVDDASDLDDKTDVSNSNDASDLADKTDVSDSNDASDLSDENNVSDADKAGDLTDKNNESDSDDTDDLKQESVTDSSNISKEQELDDLYTVYFNANKPEDAIAEPENMPEAITIVAGETIPTTIEIPSLKGNVETKIENYHAKVITVTPEELNYNLELIDRADFIVISPKSYFGPGSFDELFSKYRRTELFTTVGTKKNFFENDLSFEAMMKIFYRAAIAEERCPLIYDRSFYDSAFYGGNGSTKQVTVEKTYANGDKYSQTITGSKNNIYKLFILMQQMDPNYLYNAYIKTGDIVSVVDTDAEPSKYGVEMTLGKFTQLSGDAAIYWGAPTLLPIEVCNNYADSITFFSMMGIDKDMNQIGSTNIKNGMYSHVGDNSLTMDFYQNTISYNQYTKDAFDHLFASLSEEEKKNQKISPMDVVYYLLNSKTSNVEKYEKDITILELEPKADFQVKSYWVWFIQRLIPNFSGEINVVQQSSLEFVGKVEDLNATYDLIYLGLKSDYSYNVARPGSLIYYHLGSTVYMRNNLLGTLSGDNDNTTTSYFPGNDISRRKYNQLIEYIDAGSPVIFASKFYNDTNKSSIPTYNIDSASYMYRLADYAKSKSNCFHESSIDSKTFLKALNVSKSDINLISAPVTYKDKTLPGNESLGNEDIYVNGSNISNKILSYTFSIDSAYTDKLYQVNLYIDTNGDGIYDEVKEKLDALEVYDITSNKNVSSNQLQPGHTYKLLRTVEEYVGILPWKLEIKQRENPLVKDYVTGISALRDKVSSTDGRSVINALQIISTKNNQIFLPTDAEIDRSLKEGKEFKDIIKYNNNFISQSASNVTNYFYKYTKDLVDFDIHFTRMTVSEFEEAVATNDEVLKNYNMLILGFADMYSDISSKNAIQQIEKFIEDGKTTIFTHDTTSYVNLSKSKYNSYGYTNFWGYNINRYFRETLGMDRFGVTLMNPVDSNNRYTLEQCINELGKDGAYKNNGNQSLSNVAYEIQGYTEATLLTNSNLWMTIDEATKATSVNRGQITEYPYHIPDSFKIANSHAQYYQLDLENENLVVWYSLSGDSESYYSKTPNDVRNNYYLYNLGNITYSGLGHSSDVTETEVKLFINTMVAAFRPTESTNVSSPNIVITNEDLVTDNQENEYLYIDYDVNSYDTAVGDGIQQNGSSQTKKITYKIKDTITSSNQVLSVQYYLEDGTKIELPTYLNGTNELVNTAAMKEETEYSVNVPITSLGSGNMMKIKIVATLTLKNRAESPLETDKEVQLIRRGLFNLD